MEGIKGQMQIVTSPVYLWPVKKSPVHVVLDVIHWYEQAQLEMERFLFFGS